jgi:hypothetical protein
VLNELVRAGVIAGFRTSFDADNGPGAPLVTMTIANGQSPEDIRVRVMDALMAVAIGINVTEELAPEGLEQAPAAHR